MPVDGVGAAPVTTGYSRPATEVASKPWPPVSKLVDDRCLACGFRSGPVGSARVGGEKPTRGRSPDPGCLRRMSGWQDGSGSNPVYSLCW